MALADHGLWKVFPDQESCHLGSFALDCTINPAGIPIVEIY